MSHSTATAVPKAGGDRWFFVTADYAHGHALRDDASAILKAVKKADARAAPGKVDDVVAATPADRAFRPLAESSCPLIRTG